MPAPRVLIVPEAFLPAHRREVGGAIYLKSPDFDLLGFACTATQIKVLPEEVEALKEELRGQLGEDVEIRVLGEDVPEGAGDETCRCGHARTSHTAEAGACGASDDVGSAIEKCDCPEFRAR